MSVRERSLSRKKRSPSYAQRTQANEGELGSDAIAPIAQTRFPQLALCHPNLKLFSLTRQNPKFQYLLNSYTEAEKSYTTAIYSYSYSNIPSQRWNYGDFQAPNF